MTDDQIAELRTVLDELDDAPTIEALGANDLKFHRRIAAGAGSAVLCSLIAGLPWPTTRARIWRDVTQEGAVDQAREQHAVVCEAIWARHPDVRRS